MGKKYKVEIGRYSYKIEEGSPVVFIKEPKMDIGLLYHDRIYSLDHTVPDVRLLELPYNKNICFPVADEYVHSIWDYFSTIRNLVLPSAEDDKKRYKGQSLWDMDIDIDEYLKAIEKNEEFLDKIDKEQKDAGSILYRYLSFPVAADGKAMYQITQICGAVVKISSCKGLGDDYEYPEYGTEAVIPTEIAKRILDQRDEWAKIVEEKDKKNK